MGRNDSRSRQDLIDTVVDSWLPSAAALAGERKGLPSIALEARLKSLFQQHMRVGRRSDEESKGRRTILELLEAASTGDRTPEEAWAGIGRTAGVDLERDSRFPALPDPAQLSSVMMRFDVPLSAFGRVVERTGPVVRSEYLSSLVTSSRPLAIFDETMSNWLSDYLGHIQLILEQQGRHDLVLAPVDSDQGRKS